MKDIFKIIFYLVATVCFAALIAPPLYWAGGWSASHGFFLFLKKFPFHRFFDRAVLISALVLLWPLVKWLRVRSWNDLNLAPDPNAWPNLARGFLLALGSLALLGAGLIYSPIYELRSHPAWLQIAFLPVSAVCVALLEEGLFRGAMQGLVQRSASQTTALVFVSALYSIVHFLKPQGHHAAGQAITWLSGFELIPQAFWQFSQPFLVLGGFTTLIIAGLILGYARLRTRALWMPVGLHAGWIIGKMGLNKIADRVADAPPWFGPDLLVGIAPVLVLIFTACIVWWWLHDLPASQRD